MPEITMKFEEKTITKVQKIPDKIILDLSIEEAVALRAVLQFVTSHNNYVNNIENGLELLIGPIDISKIFTPISKIMLHSSSMALCNKEANKIREKFSEK